MQPGRPSVYDPKYCDEILEYFSVAPYIERIKKVVTKQGDVVEVPFTEAADTPTMAGFACKIGVHRETLLNWAKEHQDFFDAYTRAKDFQETFLVVNGNKGLINPQFGMFTLKNLQHWRDKQPGEEDHTVKHEGAIKIAKFDIEERVKQLEGEKE